MVSLAAVLIVSPAVFIVAASGKRIQFCDEVFSYTITNSDSPLYQLDENVWYTQEEFADKLTHTGTDSLGQYGEIPYIIVGGESIEVSGSLPGFLPASDIIRITQDYDADGAQVLEDADRFIIVCPGDENGDSDTADYGLYYYIVSTGNFAGRDFLFRRNGLNYYLGQRQNY